MSSRRAPRETERSLSHFLLLFIQLQTVFRSCFLVLGLAKRRVFGLARPTCKGVLGAVALVCFAVFDFCPVFLFGIFCFVWLTTRVTTYGISRWRFVYIFLWRLVQTTVVHGRSSHRKKDSDWRSLLLELGLINIIIVLSIITFSLSITVSFFIICFFDEKFY